MPGSQYSFLTRALTTSYNYHAASNRLTMTDPEGGVTNYVYDALSRLTALTPPAALGGGHFGFSYDKDSRRTQLTRPDSVGSNYTYDALSRLLSVSHQGGGWGPVDGATYTYDAAGNRTTATRNNPLNTYTSSYTYDPIYQLQSATQGPNYSAESYTYDAVGNRLTSTNIGGSGSYTYDSSNHLLTDAYGNTYTYDANGNRLTEATGGDTLTYAWDFENRLVGLTSATYGPEATFQYDPFGRRVEKLVALVSSFLG